MRPFLYTFFVFALLAITHLSYGQPANFKKNTFFVEGYSRDPWYSVNFDRLVLSREKLNASFRIGISALEGQIGFPIGFSLFTGAGVSHFQFSLVAMPLIVDRVRGYGNDDRFDKSLLLIPGLGYRYQNPGGGLYFHALASPMIQLDASRDYFWDFDPKTYVAASLALGYNF